MRRVLLPMILLIWMCSQATAGMVKLGWDYEGEGHLGFRLYYGSFSHADATEPMNPPQEGVVRQTAGVSDPEPYDAVVEILDPAARTYEISLPNGRWYFRMVTIGKEKDSGFTETEATAYIGLNPPTNLRVEWMLTTPK